MSEVTMRDSMRGIPGDRLTAFADPALAEQYDEWYAGRGMPSGVPGEAAARLSPEGFPGAESLLDGGRGTGHFSRWLAALELLRGHDLEEHPEVMSTRAGGDGVSMVATISQACLTASGKEENLP